MGFPYNILEIEISREDELKNWKLLAKNGCAAPIHGKFQNGLICGYLSGVTLDSNSVRSPLIYPYVFYIFLMININISHQISC